MCIRDRTTTPVTDYFEVGADIRDTKAPAGPIEKKWSTRKFQAKLVNPCLLYTSDAADERSSVDLGGRRIIKKKKKGRLRECGVHQYEHTCVAQSDARAK